MQVLEKIYFVVSVRDHNSGVVSYELADNYTQLPRGARKVYGTGHYNRDLVMKRLEKCREGTFFKEQRRARQKREEEDARVRKRIHKQYLKNLKRQRV